MAPLNNRPQVTDNDLLNGYITRYFVKFVSNDIVVEVDKKQYDKFKKNAFYQTLELKWLIGGVDKDTTTLDNKVVRGTRHKNQVTLDFYNTKMPGLKTIIRNPLEYFSGTRI